MSGQALHHTLALEDNLSANERALLAALAYYCRRSERISNPGRNTLMRKSGLSDHYLRQTLGLLEAQKLVTITRRKDPNLRYKNISNSYCLNYLPEPEAKKVEDDGVDIFRNVFSGRG